MIIITNEKLILELKKEFDNISEIVDYLKEMAQDIENGRTASYENWQIYIPDEESDTEGDD